MYDALVLEESNIEGCSFSQDGSNPLKLVYMVPFESEAK